MAAKSLNFLITGGARGIGRGLSRLLLAKGHRVFLLDANQGELEHTRSMLEKYFKSRFQCSLTNVRDPEAIKSAAKAANDFFSGHLDVLVHNAAYIPGVGGTTLENMTLEEWNASIETNLTGPMLLSQACLPMLKRGTHREHGGTIIHMSSTRAHQSEPDSEGYATTKAGLIGLTHSMAISLKSHNITVNAILPGWINVGHESRKGDIKGMKWQDGLREEDHNFHPAGRVGKVEDVLQAVEYLVNARFITGTELVVSGGAERVMYYPED